MAKCVVFKTYDSLREDGVLDKVAGALKNSKGLDLLGDVLESAAPRITDSRDKIQLMRLRAHIGGLAYVMRSASSQDSDHVSQFLDAEAMHRRAAAHSISMLNFSSSEGSSAAVGALCARIAAFAIGIDLDEKEITGKVAEVAAQDFARDVRSVLG